MFKAFIPTLGVALLLATTTSAIADDSTIDVLRTGTPHEALFAIDFIGANGYAVGAGGAIFNSKDSGKSWQLEAAPDKTALLGVAMSGDHAIAVGQLGAVLIKQGQGAWKAVETGTKERLFNVDMNSSGVAVAVGAFGALIRSTDYGQSWQNAAPEWKGVFDDPDLRLGDFFDPSLYGVAVDEAGNVWACGELALIISSKDGGNSWSIRNAGGSGVAYVSPTLSALTMRKDGTGFAVGQEGTVMKTTDSGEKWQGLNKPTGANFLGVSSTADGRVIATAMRDIQVSFNNAKTWSPVHGSDIKSGWYHGVRQLSANNTPVVVGHKGRILKLTLNH